MNKVTLISLILVIALGVVGIGYASTTWSQTMVATDTANTGTFNVYFYQAVSNDDGTTGNAIDPVVQGTWSWTSGNLTSSNWAGSRRTDGFNDATTYQPSGTGTRNLSVSMNGVYPGYWSSIACLIANSGSVPIKIDTVSYTLTAPAGGSSSDASVNFSGALVQSSHTLINAGTLALGSVDINWINVPPTSAQTYTLTVNIVAEQWNAVP